jgi:hypothetical protein
MSLRKFGRNDIILNTMRTYPPVEFFIYDSHIYYNGQPRQSGSFSDNILGINTASISLYEWNIDRGSPSDEFKSLPIYPFITKDSARASFRTSQGLIRYLVQYLENLYVNHWYIIQAVGLLMEEHTMKPPGEVEQIPTTVCQLRVNSIGTILH